MLEKLLLLLYQKLPQPVKFYRREGPHVHEGHKNIYYKTDGSISCIWANYEFFSLHISKDDEFYMWLGWYLPGVFESTRYPVCEIGMGTHRQGFTWHGIRGVWAYKIVNKVLTVYLGYNNGWYYTGRINESFKKETWQWLVSLERKITLDAVVSLLKRKLSAERTLKFGKLFTTVFRSNKS